MRHNDNLVPLMNPYLLYASMEYSEQVGINLQLRGIKGEII